MCMVPRKFYRKGSAALGNSNFKAKKLLALLAANESIIRLRYSTAL